MKSEVKRRRRYRGFLLIKYYIIMFINKQYKVEFIDNKIDDKPVSRTIEGNIMSGSNEVAIVIRDSREPNDSELLYMDFETLHETIGMLLQLQAVLKSKGGSR